MTVISLEQLNEHLRIISDAHFEHFGELKKAKYHTRQPCTIWLKFVRMHARDSDKHVHLESCTRCAEQEFTCCVCGGILDSFDALTTECPGWQYSGHIEELINTNNLDFVDGGWEVSAQGTARRMADYTNNRLAHLYGNDTRMKYYEDLPDVPF